MKLLSVSVCWRTTQEKMRRVCSASNLWETMGIVIDIHQNISPRSSAKYTTTHNIFQNIYILSNLFLLVLYICACLCFGRMKYLWLCDFPFHIVSILRSLTQLRD
jgi:hypothetical protein